MVRRGAGNNPLGDSFFQRKNILSVEGNVSLGESRQTWQHGMVFGAEIKTTPSKLWEAPQVQCSLVANTE